MGVQSTHPYIRQSQTPFVVHQTLNGTILAQIGPKWFHFISTGKNRASRYSFLHRKPNCCPRTTIHVTMSTRSTKASTFGLRSRIIRAQPSTSKCTIKTYLQYFSNVKAIQNKNSLQHSFRNKIKQKDTHITKENIKI